MRRSRAMLAILPALVEVRFLPSGRTAWVAAGTSVLDAGTAAGVEIVTGCTKGMCGTDAVLVRDGAAGVLPAADAERGTLDRMGLGAHWRLACSARVERGPVVVELGGF